MYDEAYTRLIEDMKTASRNRRHHLEWYAHTYPSYTGQVNGELLAEWLLKDGFRVAFKPNTEPRVWVVVWDDYDKDDDDADDDRE